MRWVSWALAVLGLAQYGVIAFVQPTGYVSLDTAYIVLWLCLIAALAIYAASCCSWGCGWGGCGCDCCEGCAGDDCCGRCACCTDDGHRHEHGDGHEGHSH